MMKVAGGGDGQELGEPFHKAEHQRLEKKNGVHGGRHSSRKRAGARLDRGRGQPATPALFSLPETASPRTT